MVTRLERAENDVTRNPQAVDFEKLLGDLSATFARVPANEVDNEIQRWLHRIVLALDVDRGTVTQIVSSNGGLYVTHQWAREGISTPHKGQNAEENYPWLASKVFAGELLVFSDLPHGLPAEAANERATLIADHVRSHVTVPLKIGGKIVGGVSFAKLFSERGWSEKEVQRLKLIAEIFGNALERKRAFTEFRRLETELRQVAGVVMMGELTAALAHELNQPLGAILNNARAARRLLAARKPDLTEIGEALDDIVRDNSRAVDTIRQLRALFQRGEVQMLPIDIQTIFHDIDRIVRADAEARKIDLRIDVPPSLPILFGDRTQLTQAVLNLLTNAFDSVCETNHEPRMVVLRASADAGHLHVAVCDSGKGIDSKIMPRLFDPFFTTKSTGMGMGLAIVRTIVETHGGRLWATQNPARGATLEFALPASNSHASN
jgi:signal transduction histidine kinase